MLQGGLRWECQTRSEGEHRKLGRKVIVGVVGLLLTFGGNVVGGAWLWHEDG